MKDGTISNSRAILIALLHVGVGISIVSISSFLNAEMKFADWSTSSISIYLGIPVLFELSRLFFAYLYDNYGIMRLSLFTGLFTSIIGLIALPFVIKPVGNLFIIGAVSLFYFGSSIITTLVDANLTQMSRKNERSRIAGIIQVMRLSGFALGGIVGSILYSNLSFNLFIFSISSIYFILGMVSTFFVTPVKPNVENNSNFIETFQITIKLISSGLPRLMAIFLLLYPIGLFMQDLILEPFAIDQFNFNKENVGRIVAIWTSLTLIFVPMGVWLDKKISRIFPIVVGEILSFIGLLLFALSTFLPSLPTYIVEFLALIGSQFGVSTQLTSLAIFYLGLILFGIGNGIASAPAIGMMLDVCATYPKQLTILLGFFGIMTTVGRSLAAIFGGIILQLSNDNYTLLFVVEAVVVILGVIPLIILNRELEQTEAKSFEINPIQISSIDLN